MYLTKHSLPNRFRLPPWLACGLLAVSLGCDASINSFEANRIHAKRFELTEALDMTAATQDVESVLEHLFGTPDHPLWPGMLSDGRSLPRLVSLERLERAGGAVRSDEQGTHFGLYREHCILCHGISGSGNGPTSSLLNPYPRDFRLGKVKFKSTPRGKKPTRNDLVKILENGVAGTSMPSFGLLKGEDLQALVDYMIYLAVRGEVERNLLAYAAYEIDWEGGEKMIDTALLSASTQTSSAQWQKIEETLHSVVSSWSQAEQYTPINIQPPPDFPLFTERVSSADARAQLTASIAHGRELFHGKIANCAGCHGQLALRDGLGTDFDDWTKEWTSGVGLSPLDKQQLKPMLELGALQPRPILPRNLQSGMHRGGSKPQDLYLRIVHGIDGTPMPAAPMQPENALGLSENDVWDIVNFILSLPYESGFAGPSAAAENIGTTHDEKGQPSA